MSAEVTQLPFSPREDPPSLEGSPSTDTRPSLEKVTNTMAQGELDRLRESYSISDGIQIRLSKDAGVPRDPKLWNTPGQSSFNKSFFNYQIQSDLELTRKQFFSDKEVFSIKEVHSSRSFLKSFALDSKQITSSDEDNAEDKLAGCAAPVAGDEGGGAERVEDGGPPSLLHGQQWKLYELSHELICSSLWPINSEDRQRREEAGAEKSPAPNGFQIGVQTSPHAPFEVRRIRSTRPTRARGRRRLEFTRHAPPHAPEVTHAPARTDRRVQSTVTRAHAPREWLPLSARPSTLSHAPARASRVAASRAHAPHAPSQPQPHTLSRHAREPIPSRAIAPCEKPRMKDTEGDELEDDWADQTMHWTRGDVPGEDISEQSLIEKACVEASERDYSGGTNERVLESHRKRSKEEAREDVSRRRSQRRDKKNCPRNKAQDQSSEAATTAMMAVDESDVLLAASAEMKSQIGFLIQELLTTCAETESGGTLRVSKRNRRSCKRRKTGRLYRLRENVQTGELLSDIGPVVLARWMDEKEATVAQRHAKQAQEYLMDVLEGSTVEQERKEMLWDTCGSLARHEKVQPLQDVHEKAQRRETESMHNDRRDVAKTSLFRSRSVAVISLVVHTREERWSHDDLQSDVLCRAPRGGAERVEDGGPPSLLHGQQWKLYELSHELICSSLWPISSEDRQRREEAGAEKCKGLGSLIGAHSRMLCAEGLGERGLLWCFESTESREGCVL
ncbi:hypothetical protein Acr_21g0004750 [Actinidia rufa]|uniref:Uncharacterized protein n=1 Tax=Actinidia rufa TaxID=165716 RepID=A0A7J0GGE8_9ERIC|nr:hypothetical protein Acr_21g0004750 [Actinidia rufa]